MEANIAARCEICGSPGWARTLGGTYFCQECAQKYTEFHCERCGQRVVSSQVSTERSPICGSCLLEVKLDGVAAEDLKKIEKRLDEGSVIRAVKEAHEILGLSVGDAKHFVSILRRRRGE